jgi:lipid II:glycine glycyltransferase (peptidoglycan interpeptide bridge formation enzyme)
LDLSKSTDELSRSMSKRGRWGIKKAEKAGVKVDEGGLQDLPSYYQMHLSTCRRLKIPPTSLQMFRALFDVFSHEKNIGFFLAKYNARPIAGCIILKWLDKMWYVHGDSLNSYWNLNANHLLQWNVIRWGKTNGVRIYDMFGIPCTSDEVHPKRGLYLFKTQFGGHIEKHGEYVKHYFPFKSIFVKKVLQPFYGRFSIIGKWNSFEASGA